MKLKILFVLVAVLFFNGCVGDIIALPVKAVGKTVELTGDAIGAIVP